MYKITDKAQQTLTHLGLKLRAAREASDHTQEDVATAAKVGRSTLVHIESGKSANLSNILAVANVLGVEVGIADAESAQSARRLARLVQDANVQARKEAHLRLALLMLTDAAAAKPLVTEARNTVRVWRTNKSCSPFYIDAWDKILTGTPRDVGKSIAAMDARWENALHQNTPFASALIANRVAAK
jgi:transcriptional regulator with XRE-family HTH domain